MSLSTIKPSKKLEEIGGKALNLLKLKEMGMNVPPFVVVSQDVMLDTFPSSEKVDISITKEFILSADISKGIYELINKNIASAENKLFAVRSSGIQEDGKVFSFAGQFDSYLYVSYSDIPSFVKEVWLSNYSDRVLAYTETNNLRKQKGIAVIIQEMIDADVSGVGFGINPNTGEEGSRVISSVYGVGEGLVSGALNADTFLFFQGQITSDIVRKEREAKRLSSGKIELKRVETPLQLRPSLSKVEIEQLSKILGKLEKELGSPQDIEFAIKNHEIFLLQTRPITAVFNQNSYKSSGKNRIIWDNSNIIESYPGVTTPLTFSYVLNAYRQVYAQLALIFGVSKKKIDKNKSTFNSMLGLVNGRVYYNLFSWYRMLGLFPGYKLNARFMENMMGVKERFDLPKENDSYKVSAVFRTIWMAIRIIVHAITIKKQTRRYLSDVENSISEYKKLDLAKMTAFELKEEWIEIEAYLTSKWKAPILTDSFALFYFGKLQGKIKKYKMSKNLNLQNDLLCGSQDIISVEPIHRTIALASQVSENDELKNLFNSNQASDIWLTLLEGEYPITLKNILSFIEDFGDRCVGELKLETISYKQEPSLYIDIIKSFVAQGITSKKISSNIDQDLRNNGEKEVNKALRYRPIRKWKFYKTLNKTRFLVSNRENLRYERTRVFGLTREMFSQIGREFEKAGALDSYRDIFYLTMQEMFGFIDGSSVDTDLKALTEMRKAQYKEYESMDLPAERFTTYDAVNFGNNFFDTSVEEDLNFDLKGTGCCPGIVRAKVRLVKHPSEIASMDGDILVTSSTDPGWVTLFPTASAIIVERGSLLSHSAIVSREMGIPCIVGVTGLLKTLKTGDLIEMDGSTGIIKIIEDE